MADLLTLKDLGYRFDENGEFRKISDNGRFVFTNQEDYEKLGNVMTTELYSILVNQCGLERLKSKMNTKICANTGVLSTLPVIFATSPLYFLSFTAVVQYDLGNGLGEANLRLILNEGLNVGSQIPYIQRAHNNDWGVILCNTNTDENFREYPRQHLRAVYDQLLSGTSIQRILVVAHSRGGQDFAYAFPYFKNDERFVVVSLTDSLHFKMPDGSSEAKGPVFINWTADSSFQQISISDEDNANMFSRVHQIYAGLYRLKGDTVSEHENLPMREVT
uniref:Alpha/beta hydrolase n=1 Tax=Angiostrongylus cantonensis TaxID=6313 RepID=A0A0K0CTP0_ANGCA